MVTTASGLGQVLMASPQELAVIPLDLLNLLCASGLPDTADLDINACLKTLAGWAAHVGQESERNYRRFQRDPGQYRHSEAYYRVIMMVTVLQEDCGVRYDPECIKLSLFLDSGEGFLHGLLSGRGQGTCANLPVLYAAIGRRLGYPIFLCLAGPRHVFCRWTSHEERFNIEGSGVGLTTPEDDYYLNWPRPISPREVEVGHFLRDLAPQEELAMFMATRGHCLLDRGHLCDAIVAYAHAHPSCPNPAALLLVFLLGDQSGYAGAGRGQACRQLPGGGGLPFAWWPKLVQYVVDASFPRVEKQHSGLTGRSQMASEK